MDACMNVYVCVYAHTYMRTHREIRERQNALPRVVTRVCSPVILVIVEGSVRGTRSDYLKAWWRRGGSGGKPSCLESRLYYRFTLIIVTEGIKLDYQNCYGRVSSFRILFSFGRELFRSRNELIVVGAQVIRLKPGRGKYLRSFAP